MNRVDDARGGEHPRDERGERGLDGGDLLRGLRLCEPSAHVDRQIQRFAHLRCLERRRLVQRRRWVIGTVAAIAAAATFAILWGDPAASRLPETLGDGDLASASSSTTAATAPDSMIGAPVDGRSAAGRPGDAGRVDGGPAARTAPEVGEDPDASADAWSSILPVIPVFPGAPSPPPSTAGGEDARELLIELESLRARVVEAERRSHAVSPTLWAQRARIARTVELHLLEIELLELEIEGLSSQAENESTQDRKEP